MWKRLIPIKELLTRKFLYKTNLAFDKGIKGENVIIMKKIISVVSIILGALLIVQAVAPISLATILRMQISDAASIGIIGGADGPTSIMIAGRIGNSSVIVEVLAAILLIGVGIWGYRRNSRS